MGSDLEAVRCCVHACHARRAMTLLWSLIWRMHCASLCRSAACPAAPERHPRNATASTLHALPCYSLGAKLYVMQGNTIAGATKRLAFSACASLPFAAAPRAACASPEPRRSVHATQVAPCACRRRVHAQRMAHSGARQPAATAPAQLSGCSGASVFRQPAAAPAVRALPSPPRATPASQGAHMPHMAFTMQLTCMHWLPAPMQGPTVFPATAGTTCAP